MIPFCLSTTGVAFCEFEQSHVAGRGGVSVFGKFFCQTTLPVSASNANTVSSMLTVKTRVLPPTPCTTSGEVSVESTTSFGTTGTCVLQSIERPETLSFDNV